MNYNVTVIKNIHEHQIDKEQKDTYKYGEAGAVFSITKNIDNETTIFLKKEVNIDELLKWIGSGPYKIDVVLIEGFRNLNYPTILCLKNWEELESQLTTNVKAISGVICSKNFNGTKKIKLDTPIINIQEDFEKFLEIFKFD